MSTRYAFLPGIIPVMIAEWLIAVIVFRFYRRLCCCCGKEDREISDDERQNSQPERNAIVSFSQTYTSYGNGNWGRTILLMKRLFCLGYMLGAGVINSYIHDLPEGWFYFTFWNIELMTFYYFLAVACSLMSFFAPQEVLQSKSTHLFGRFVQAVYEVTGGTAFFITLIDFAFLNPVFTFFNGTQHFANSMFMLSEVFMSDIPVRLDHFPINLSWALLYLIFIWPLTVLKTSPSADWPYTFLDTSTAWCFLWYNILYVVDFLTYFLFYGFHELKFHLVHRFSLRERKEDADNALSDSKDGGAIAII